MKKPKGFTLIEIVVTMVIIAAVAVLVIPKMIGQVRKAQEAEAVQNLGSIRSAELLLHHFFGRFVEAADEASIGSALGLLVNGNFFKYHIADATEENFLAVATPVEPWDNWLEEIRIDKNGFIGYPSGEGEKSGSSAGSGGASSSGSGSSGGYSSGRRGSDGSVGGGGGGRVSYGTVTAYYTITEKPITDATFAAPTELQLTPNDGWIVLNFKGNTNADGYQILRCNNVDIQAGEVEVCTVITGNTVWQSPTWADNPVIDGSDVCYRAQSLKQVDGRWIVSEESGRVCGRPAPNADYEAKTEAAIETLLSNTQSFSSVIEPPAANAVPRTPGTWEDVVRSLTGNNIPILFAKMHDVQITNLRSEISLGGYNPLNKTIVINDKYANAPKEMIAAILVHEGLHQMWGKDWDDGAKLYGRPPDNWTPPADFVAPRSRNSRKQEYNSFVGGSQVWAALKSRIAEPLNSNAIQLRDMLNDQQADFLDTQGNPHLFSEAGVTQFFSMMTGYKNLPDY
ncbi:MAG: hypothetical protein BWY42_00040 [Candidatus Omnitrophica bacterium ADurb.Bin277]|nr:MAG: hypothetical protein BWY42_00040 [Candidatus Omnitrophica bacterium ADurb.Bin277]